MNDLTLNDYNLDIIKGGFMPAVIDNKKMQIVDVVNDKKYIFELENQTFKTYSYKNKEYKGNIPKKIADTIDKNIDVFDEYEIVKPEGTPKNLDPFLFGAKDGKKYFICCWETEIWEIV